MSSTKAVVAPLPTTVAGLDEIREKAGAKPFAALRNINDAVEIVHRALWSDVDLRPRYTRFLEAVTASDAVEGSLIADDYEAAHMIREYARDHENSFVGDKDKTTILRALKIVLRRDHIGREERARQLDGKDVAD